jgi:hypothetical protein
MGIGAGAANAVPIQPGPSAPSQPGNTQPAVPAPAPVPAPAAPAPGNGGGQPGVTQAPTAHAPQAENTEPSAPHHYYYYHPRHNKPAPPPDVIQLGHTQIARPAWLPPSVRDEINSLAAHTPH